MSEDLLRKLQILEEDYASQPVVAQQMDLQEINRIRSQLGMLLVDAHLKEIGVVAVKEEPQPKPKEVPDHTEAREIYRAYLKKIEEIEPHKVYADQVVRATGGLGPTPVRPLATMGTDGGPLLCDYCRKPIVLEGGPHHGMAADVAWRKNPLDNWKSWILGGMVVEIQTNDTLRIYHGYPDRGDRYCCNAARREDERERAEFESHKRPEKLRLILAFLEYEFPNMASGERLSLLNKILSTMYSYDPGIGMNRPRIRN